MSKKEENTDAKCRRGFARRSYSYAHHIPERRSGEERRKMEDNAECPQGKCTAESHCDFDSTVLDEGAMDQAPTQHPTKKNTP